MDSNFNNNPGGNSAPPPAPAADAKAPVPPAGNGATVIVPGGETKMSSTAAGPAPIAPAPETKVPLSAAGERFHACRWRKAAENGAPDHCTHRDVLPMAGTTGFVPESWCSDCGYFKAKRSPRKRPEEGQQQDDWRRW